jgi:hypothetical protein
VTAFTMQAMTHAGGLITYTAPAATNNTAPPGADVSLIIKNASGGSVNVDIHIPASNTVDGLVVATPAGGAAPARRVVAAVGDTLIPIPDNVYADPSNSGLATFDVSSITSITAACVRTA